ncbi:MAG: hypothetical protein A2X86_00445 [Bdellovibrionales bacterium GWA2_49_15]|nr:MAG: hypothetical protein A2X86_00445 [Bdellovibrionales bacterium GWA2_49_15]HAZ13265.1 hypothetical protein [Bdellovibrionales bacterium]
MKKMIFTFVTTALLASSSFAQDLSNTTIELSKTIKEAKLFDGRKVDFQKEVEKLHLFDNKIDFLELRSGEIVDRTDIRSIQLLDSHRMILKATGVDGGG